jgi:hypothetical protein
MPNGPPQPLILFVPGLKPKPENVAYRQQLWRCLIEGVRRCDESIAENMANAPACFQVAGWTQGFYGEDRDIDLDLPGIEAVLAQRRASERDIAEATTLRRRFIRLLRETGDRLPFLIPHFANQDLRETLVDVRRYMRNIEGCAEEARLHIWEPLVGALEKNRPVLLIAHSMGSVLSYDCLWLLGRIQQSPQRVDTWLTMGSPLGKRFVRRRLQGAGMPSPERYPRTIRRWINVVAVGELTATDRYLGRTFAAMARLGLVECIEDYDVFNYFRADGELNVHTEYGYLVNEQTGSLVAEWWKDHAATG